MKTGFTLVELLVVIAIIAILSVVGLVVFTNIQKNARNAKIREDINSIASAYESNYAAASSYQALAGTDFAGGKIPVPYPGGEYFVAGPNKDDNNQNFVVCGSLVGDNTCYENSASCFCRMSSQGSPVDTFPLGNLVLNGSFETDGNWQGCGWQGSCSDLTTYTQHGSVSRKLTFNNCTNCTGTNFRQENISLEANSNYSVSVWIKNDITFTGNAYWCLGGGPVISGGCPFTLSMNTPHDDWTKVTQSASTGGTAGTATLTLGMDNLVKNISDTRYVYFDAVQIEKMH